jgi:hypothetical protein
LPKSTGRAGSEEQEQKMNKLYRKPVVGAIVLIALAVLILVILWSALGESGTAAPAQPPSATATTEPTVTSEPTATPEPCAAADLLLQQAQLENAQTAYATITTASPDAQCAVRGLQAVDIQRCAAARRLAEAGLAEQSSALMALVDDLSLCGLDALPVKEVKSPPTPTPTPTPTATPLTVGVAEKFGQLKLPEKAYENFITAVTENPENPKLYELGEVNWAKWELFKNRIKEWQPFTGAALLGVLVLLIVLALVIYNSVQKYRVDIDKFTFSSVKFDPAIDPNDILVAEMERGLNRLQRIGKHSMMGLVDGPVTEIDLNIDLSPLPKQIGALWKFFSGIIPKKMITISGVLGFSSQNGASLMVRLIQEQGGAKGLFDVRTIHQKEFDPDYKPNLAKPELAAYLDLARIATLWVFWKITELDLGKPAADRKLLAAFSTADWRSHSFNHLAVRYIDQLDSARWRFTQALVIDANNRAALYNQTYLDYLDISLKPQPKETSEFSQFIRRFKDLIPPLEQIQTQADKPRDFYDVFALYTQGAIYLYQTLDPLLPGNEMQQAFNCARKALDEAWTAYESLIEQFRESGSYSEYDHELHFIDVTRLTAQAAYKTSDAETWKRIIKIESEHKYIYSVLYNLACYYSQLAGLDSFEWSASEPVSSEPCKVDGKPEKPRNKEEAIQRSFDLLIAAKELEPGIASFISSDPQLHTLLVDRELDFIDLSGSRLAESLATIDKEIISQELLEKLGEKKIKTLEDLIVSGDSYAKRRALAGDLGISSLVCMADLLQIRQLTPKNAYHLARVDFDRPQSRFGTVERLQNAEAEPVRDCFEDPKPTLEDVHKWIETAKKAKSRIKL